MKISYIIFIISLLFTLQARAELSDTPTQSTSNSCGAMALSVLLSGAGQRDISEKEVMSVARTLKGENDDDYSIGELELAAQKLGFQVKVGKISPEQLKLSNLPVVLLTGLPTKSFRHFVVLKGVVDDIAYIYDPIRKNIRMPYQRLIEMSIDQEFSKFYFIAVNSSADMIQKRGRLAIPSGSSRNTTHMTEAQANALIASALSKAGQTIVEFQTARSKNSSNEFAYQNLSNTLSVRYGVNKNTQIGGSLTQNKMAGDFGFSDKQTQLAVFSTRAIRLSEMSNFNVGVNFAHGEQQNFAGVNLLTSYSSNLGNFFAGASYNKPLNGEDKRSSISYSLGTSKNLGDYFVGSVNTSYDKYAPSLGAGLTYVINRRFQVNGSLGKTFSDDTVTTLGLGVAYVGGW